MDKTQTFADIGIPFRLYQAPIETCSKFKGRGTCSVCERDEQWVFRAGIGDDLIVECPNCNEPNALDCAGKADGVCTRCQSVTVWPLARADELMVCYDCLRAGRVHLTQDSERGLVTWRDARDGWTPSEPDENAITLPSRLSDDGAPVPREDLAELGRTPSYTTWQGERWQFHCGRAMCYIGEPLTRPREQATPAIERAIETALREDDMEITLEEAWDSIVCVYLFRCEVCGALAGHSDVD